MYQPKVQGSQRLPCTLGFPSRWRFTMNMTATIEMTSRDKVSELISEIKKGVAYIHTSEDWKKWLDFNSRFWAYSFHNQMLIAIQKPTATRVAGFHTWKDCKRHVKKGERGIKILAPIIIKTAIKDEETGEEKTVKALRNFRIVTVFDISQTEGEEMPSIHSPLQGVAPSGVFDSLKILIERKGYTVTFKDLPEGLYGYVNKSKQIVLRQEESEAQSLDTLCHEMSHAILGHVDSDTPRNDQELEAETSAWIICRNLGLETRKSSFAYLATWTAGKDRDTKLEKAGHRGCEAAREILGGLAISEVPEICPAN